MSLKRNVSVHPLFLYSALGILFGLALALRVSLYGIQTSDYTAFVSRWYDYIQSNGGFAALKYNFSNYNVPYLYLLTLLTYLPIPKLIAAKSLSVVFDCVLGLFTYLIVSQKYKRTYAALIGALVVLFAPTVVVNGSAWGQCDSIYAAFCLGSLYFLIKKRPAWACVFFALGLSFKLQAIFFLPVLLILALKRELALKYLALIPLVFLLLLVPAFLAGRDAVSLLSIYANQADSGGVTVVGQGNNQNAGRFGNGGPGSFDGRGSRQSDSQQGQSPNNAGSGQNPPAQGQPGGRGQGQFAGRGQGQLNGGGRVNGRSSWSSTLTLNAPTIYQWFPGSASPDWKWLGIFLAAAFVSALGLLVMKSKQMMTTEILLKLALTTVVAVPFLLPEMHERYFFLADVMSIAFVFFFPRLWFVALIMQLSSLLAYAPYMLNWLDVGLQYVSFGVLALMIILTADLLMSLYPDLSQKFPLLNVLRRQTTEGEPGEKPFIEDEETVKAR